MCHRGIARELATILGVSLVSDPLKESTDLPVTDKIQIRIADHEACPRFTASLISGIEVKDSPEWLQKRLRALGQRPINNIVDATNYVMYAIGQPIHAYDADLFPQEDGKWKIAVRFAEENETVSLLSEGGKDEERIVELDGSELLIVDESTNVPVGLAGVKGGKYAGVHSGTTNIIIEAAHFHPIVTRKTARRLGIVIEASKRFENEPSRKLPPYAQKEIVKLITDIAGGECEGVVDKFVQKKEPLKVIVTVARINSLLGLSLRNDEVRNILLRTGSIITDIKEGVFEIIGPFERTDLNIEEDYIEEVGRIHGLSSIESVEPTFIEVPEINPRQYYGDKVRIALMNIGFTEVITSTFQKKGKLQLKNSLASDKSYLRSSLVNNLNAVLDANYAHVDLLALADVRVFEIGTVFSHEVGKVSEKVVLTLGARTKGNGYNPKDDKVLKEGMASVAEALGKDLDWQIEKGVAELDLSAALKDLPTPIAYIPLLSQVPAAYKTISQYPAIARDVALWVGESENPKSVISTLTRSAGELCVRQTLFDTFTKGGRTSYAFRLVFQAEERTLTDLEINAVMQNIYQIAEEKGWEVR